MNQGLHRVIFNAARGLRMVVAETAVGAGKGNSKGHMAATDSASASGWRAAVFAIGWTALAALSMLGFAPEAHAQIVPNPFAAAGQKPQVLVAPNGVPLVNITTPSAAGVSINQYNQFDVNAAGAILNNSRTTASTQLGGLVQGNPWLATGPARIIVNQVSSSNPSYLNGYIEVAGQRAEVIIANPSGINVNGGGFINTSRATLTTGTPQYGAMGTLDAFLVHGGTVTIDGNGLDLSTTDYAAILSRALQVNAAIYASELKVVTGANQVSADHAQVTPTAGTGTAPTFALDVSALGGMYARKITLIGTEAGLGVRNAGSIGASAGNLVVTAAGRLENTGTLEGQSIQLASTGGDIDNRGGTIRQTSTASLAIAAPTLSNTNGGWIGGEPLSTCSGAGTGTTGSTGGTGTAPTTTTGTTGSTGTGSGSGSGSGSIGTTTAAAPVAPPDPGSITAAGSILNDGGKIYAGGPITLQSPNIVNTGGTLSVANMALNQQSFSNHGGTLTIQAGSLASANGGNLRATHDVQVTASGALTNAGSITAGHNTTLSAGSVQSSTGSVLGAGIQADGTLASTGDLNVTAANALAANGTNLAAGNASLQGASVDLGGGTTNAANIALAATSGNVTTSGAKVVTPGTLSITAKSNASQALINDGGNLRGQSVSIDVSNLRNKGEILHTDAGSAANVRVSNQLDNSGGHILSSGGAVISAGQAVQNTAGVIAANSALSLSAGAVDNTDGTIASVASRLDLSVDANLTNLRGSIEAKDAIHLQATHLGNAGNIVADNISIQAGALDNSSGAIAATSSIAVGGGDVTNTAGLIQSGGDLRLDLQAGTLLNSQSDKYSSGSGGLIAGQTLSIHAGDVSNQDGGYIGSSGALSINASGHVFNTASSEMVSSKSIDLSAVTITNSASQIQALEGINLAAPTGLVENLGGLIRSNGDVAIQASNVRNSGSSGAADKGIEGRNLRVTAENIDNSQGALRADENLSLVASARVDNTGGIASAGKVLEITDPASGTATPLGLAVLNTGGTLIAGEQLHLGLNASRDERRRLRVSRSTASVRLRRRSAAKYFQQRAHHAGARRQRLALSTEHATRFGPSGLHGFGRGQGAVDVLPEAVSGAPKMRTRQLALALALVVTTTLIGCVSPTSYRAAETDGIRFGYSNTKLSDQLYRVRFMGTGRTPARWVDAFLLYRAAEVAKEAQAPAFKIVEGNVDTSVLEGEDVYGDRELDLHAAVTVSSAPRQQHPQGDIVVSREDILGSMQRTAGAMPVFRMPPPALPKYQPPVFIYTPGYAPVPLPDRTILIELRPDLKGMDDKTFVTADVLDKLGPRIKRAAPKDPVHKPVAPVPS